MAEPYLYPGTTVLQNKEGIQDQAELDRFERFSSAQRAKDLVVSDRDLHSTKAPAIIHRQLFQDTYAWAGQHRTVNIHKTDHFLPAGQIELGLAEVVRSLNASAPPAALAELKQAQRAGKPGTADAFAARVVAPMSELNYVHPFREGNGRMTRTWLDQLATRAGLQLDNSKIDKQQWITGSIESTRDPSNTDRLQQQIAAALVPADRARNQQADRAAPKAVTQRRELGRDDDRGR